MTIAVVYIIKDEVAIEKFECEYETAIQTYYGKKHKRGNYYIARKGIKIPFPEKGKELKNINRSSEESQKHQPSQEPTP